MLIGPFDRRKRRSRCDACSKSHLKCSGNSPCGSCVKRSLPCHYSLVVSSKRLGIRVDRGKQETTSTFEGASCPPSVQILKPLTADPTLFYFSYYKIFLRKNKFTGLETPRKDVAGLMKLADSESYLRNAMLSLGAMQAVKLCEASKSKRIHQFALESYTRAIAGLRHALVNIIKDPEVRARILWTTLLLGLFELMNDSTGNGWLQHLVHGTSQALIAGGPSTCISGSCGRFFAEARVFEACRSIIYNQTSFLSGEGWMALSASLRTSSTSRLQQTLDELLDVVVMCSSLRVQAADLVKLLRSSPSVVITERARAISLHGFELRNQLHDWASINHTSDVFQDPGRSPGSELEPEAGPEFQLLAETFFSATSIYLSGVFDYEICYWHSLNLPAPTLSEDEIQQHVGFILALGYQLVKTDISSLLLLFPLRVASARARQTWQRQQIMELLGMVKASFAVAGAFVADIENLWKHRTGK